MNLSKSNKEEYFSWVKELKRKIQSSQLKAALSVNSELLSLYWELGRAISEKIASTDWGSSVVEILSKDLQKELPDQKGFSRSNLFSMKKWYEFYSSANIEVEKVQQLVGEIPWGHNIVIVTQSSSAEEALFYCMKTIENNWSRSVLTHQIDLDLFHRKGKAITNFETTLPEIQSELALETLKDPYKFDFLTLQEKALEKNIEEQLVKHIVRQGRICEKMTPLFFRLARQKT